MILTPFAVIYGTIYVNEHVRVLDAEPAFRPIESLGCEIPTPENRRQEKNRRKIGEKSETGTISKREKNRREELETGAVSQRKSETDAVSQREIGEKSETGTISEKSETGTISKRRKIERKSETGTVLGQREIGAGEKSETETV